MVVTHESPKFEVRCHHCDVSFPVGTRTCIHCGERIGRPALLRLGRDPEVEFGELDELQPVEEATSAEEYEPPRGRLIRVGVTLVWVVVALLSAMARSCQEG